MKYVVQTHAWILAKLAKFCDFQNVVHTDKAAIGDDPTRETWETLNNLFHLRSFSLTYSIHASHFHRILLGAV